VYWQTGHIDAIRPAVILEKNSMSGEVILPLVLDPRYTVDIDNLSDWTRAEWLVRHAGLDMVFPGRRPRPFPERVEALVLDFDGVMTDNRVWVDENGHEQVAANRSDSLGLSLLRQQTGIQVMVLSKEVNPVVAARCQKLRLPYLQGIDDKAAALMGWLAEKHLDAAQVLYVGNDVNDLPCFSMVGYTAAPADAQPEVACQADLILSRRGGYGAVREICDLLIQEYIQRSSS